jgi:hypothetical protein
VIDKRLGRQEKSITVQYQHDVLCHGVLPQFAARCHDSPDLSLKRNGGLQPLLSDLIQQIEAFIVCTVLDRVRNADALIIGTPVYYGTESSSRSAYGRRS